MANPYRPAYKGTIESSWGAVVADHVTRRYGSPAERDADLGEFTPSELEGQLVAVGAPPLLELRSGNRWIALPDFQGGIAWITTDGASSGYIGFPRPFAAVPTFLLVSSAMQNGITVIPNDAVSATQWQVSAWNAAGQPFGAGNNIKLHYLAGYIPGTTMVETRPEIDGEPGDVVSPRRGSDS